MAGRRHEALDAVGARVGLRKIDELEAVGRNGAHARLEADARPLLNLVAIAGEVDPADSSHAPLRVREAARVAVDNRMVGHLRRERIVDLAVLIRLLAALLSLPGALPFLGAGLARRGGADLDGVSADAAAAQRLGQLLERVCSAVDRLKVALVRSLLAGRR